MAITLVFALGMLLSALSGRIMVLANRSRVIRRLTALNAFFDFLGIIAGLSFWGLILWGFSSLIWYFALPIVLVCGFIGGIAANPPRFEFFFKAERVIDLATIAVTAWLWVSRWPY